MIRGDHGCRVPPNLDRIPDRDPRRNLDRGSVAVFLFWGMLTAFAIGGWVTALYVGLNR